MTDTITLAALGEIEGLVAKAAEESRMPWESSGNMPMVWDDSGDAIVSTMEGKAYFEPQVADAIAATMNAAPALIRLARKAIEAGL